MPRALSLLLVLAAVAWAVPARALNRVVEIRHSVAATRVRLVLETAEKPVWQVYPVAGGQQLVIELLDVDIREVPPFPGCPHGSLLAGWRLRPSGLDRLQWVVLLNYPLPPQNVRTMVLEDPHRLVVDLHPRYSIEETFALSRAVTWRRLEEVGPEGYLLWNELSFDPTDPSLRLDIGLAQDRLDARETPRSMARRHGALAAVNGGFFDSRGGPLGLVVRQGRILSPHVGRRPPRTALGLTREGRVLIDRVMVRGRMLAARDGGTWKDVELALGGGPRLLHRGRLYLTTEAEGLGKNGNDITRPAGRTAVALGADGRMLLVTASGYRDNHRQGLTLEALADRLLRRGAREAMNLDGGASTAMVVAGRVVSDGPGNRSKEKPVATALLLYDENPPTRPHRVELHPREVRLLADGESTTELVARVTTPSGEPVPDGTPVRFRAEGLVVPFSALTRDGEARVEVRSLRRPGLARVHAEAGTAGALTYLRLQAGETRRLVHRVFLLGPREAQEGDPLRQKVRLLVAAEDAYFNPVAGQELELAAAGLEVVSRKTGEEGLLDVTFLLPLEGGEITLAAPGLEPVRLLIPAWVEDPD